MLKIKISLAAIAFIVGIGSALATQSQNGLEECEDNIPPIDCQFQSLTDPCCYTIDEEENEIVWSRVQ